VLLRSAANMRHLIVKACIARNLMDTSVYFWPGYVNGCINQIPHSVPAQVPGWSSFMKGAPLSPVMVNALVSSPASRTLTLHVKVSAVNLSRSYFYCSNFIYTKPRMKSVN
jgi:hypothetical protein